MRASLWRRGAFSGSLLDLMARVGLTARQEVFAQEVSLGASLGEAYRRAGYRAEGNRVYEKASVLAKASKVKARVAQLQEAQARSRAATAVVTAQTITSMLAEAFEDAKRWKQTGAQVAAAMGLAKLHGLLVDKTEDVTRRATRNPDAPIEIDVDHWVNEQVALLAPASDPPTPPVDPAPAGHGAPLPEPGLAVPGSPADVEGASDGEPSDATSDAGVRSLRSPKGSRALN